MVCCGSRDDTPQSCTSAIPEMDFAFGSKNPTDVSQLSPLGVGVSIYVQYVFFIRFLGNVFFESNHTIRTKQCIWTCLALILNGVKEK